MSVSESERQFFTQCAVEEPNIPSNGAQMVGNIELPDFNELMHELASIYFNLGPAGYAKAIEDHRSNFAVACAWNNDFKQLLLVGLRMGIEEGDGSCALQLGSLYYTGDVVEQDYGKAAELYGIAAAQGIPQAMVNLGYIYEYGRTGQRDYAKAYMYYSFAAAVYRDSEALYKMGDMFSRGKGVEQNRKAAVTLWSASFESTDDLEMQAQSALRIGKVFVDRAQCEEMGVEFNPLTALELFQKAEAGLRLSISKGYDYYRDRLQEALDGQQIARQLLEQQA